MYAAAQFVGQPCHMGYHSFIKTLLNGAAWGPAIAVSKLTMSSVKIILPIKYYLGPEKFGEYQERDWHRLS
jgi:hypothetical protein